MNFAEFLNEMQYIDERTSFTSSGYDKKGTLVNGNDLNILFSFINRPTTSRPSSAAIVTRALMTRSVLDLKISEIEEEDFDLGSSKDDLAASVRLTSQATL